MRLGHEKLVAHDIRHCNVRKNITLLYVNDGSLASSCSEKTELFKDRFLEVHRQDDQGPDYCSQVAAIVHPWVPVAFTTEVKGCL